MFADIIRQFQEGRGGEVQTVRSEVPGNAEEEPRYVCAVTAPLPHIRQSAQGTVTEEGQHLEEQALKIRTL